MCTGICSGLQFITWSDTQYFKIQHVQNTQQQEFQRATDTCWSKWTHSHNRKCDRLTPKVYRLTNTKSAQTDTTLQTYTKTNIKEKTVELMGYDLCSADCMHILSKAFSYKTAHYRQVRTWLMLHDSPKWTWQIHYISSNVTIIGHDEYILKENVEYDAQVYLDHQLSKSKVKTIQDIVLHTSPCTKYHSSSNKKCPCKVRIAWTE